MVSGEEPRSVLCAGVDEALHWHDAGVVLDLSVPHCTLQALFEVGELLGRRAEQAAVCRVCGVTRVDVGASPTPEGARCVVLAFLLDLHWLLLWEERAAACVCWSDQLGPAEFGECIGTIPVVKERWMVLLRSGHARPGPDVALQVSDGSSRIPAKLGG